MHWSFCRDPYGTTHLDAKQNNNYFHGVGPTNQGQQHLNQSCNCGTEHDPELDAVIKAKNLNIRKACRAWGRGKHVCYDCGFLVNKDGHEERCSTANNRRSSRPDDRGNEASVPAGKDRHYHYEQYLKGGYDEATEGRGETIYTEHELPDVLVPTIAIPEGLMVNLSLYQQVAGEAQGAWVGTLQCQDWDNARLEQMIREVRHITNEQQEMAQQVHRQGRYGVQWPFPKDRNGLVRASAWTGELL
jgi:hypothetical protein